jgi:predicted nuclease of predicted toxin-antitoxin system
MGWVSVAELIRLDPPSRREVEQVFKCRRQRAKVGFYVDENFPAAATRILERMRARVVTVQNKGLRGLPDENHAAYALRHGLVLVSCDRDYLDERRFPIVHCPAIAVFNFGSGSVREIDESFVCLKRVVSMPQFFDKWVKIDANPHCWTEYTRFLNGTTSRSRFRVFRGNLQEWIEDVCP